jgi:hypothetical protein
MAQNSIYWIQEINLISDGILYIFKVLISPVLAFRDLSRYFSIFQEKLKKTLKNLS